MILLALAAVTDTNYFREENVSVLTAIQADHPRSSCPPR